MQILNIYHYMYIYIIYANNIYVCCRVFFKVGYFYFSSWCTRCSKKVNFPRQPVGPGWSASLRRWRARPLAHPNFWFSPQRKTPPTFPEGLLAFWKGNGWKWDHMFFFQESLGWWKIVPCGKRMVEKQLPLPETRCLFAPWKLMGLEHAPFGEMLVLWSVYKHIYKPQLLFFLGCNPWLIFHGFGVSS